MEYWVYGLDVITKQPRKPLRLEADSEEAARAQATKMGMQVEAVDPTQPQVNQRARQPSDHPIATFLVIVFRFLAALSAVLYVCLVVASANLASTMEVGGTAAVLRTIVQGILVVSIFLAVAEVLRLGIAIERNTRGRVQAGQTEREGEGKHP